MINTKPLLKWLALVVYLFSVSLQLRADDGMWLLALLKRYNAQELKAMGLKIPIEQLTGENEGAISEAVIAFDKGCTGSIISSNGLILTNYHCSYSAIQQYVNPTNDIFQNGFWAKSTQEELPVSGLTITINKKILDITNEVESQMNNSTSSHRLQDAIATATEKYKKQYPQYKIQIKPYKNNSIFVLYLQLQYSDVRLVGVAPKNVAKFGGETDNWMWPRQSCDFAFFRVYGKNGVPASYAPTNTPLAVKTYLHVSTDGYKKGEFAMSMGYPSQSDRNATSYQINDKEQTMNAPLIAVRKVRQSILEDEMNKNPVIKQMYAEKFATSANYYKNAVGMNDWINKLNIISKKQASEKAWTNWIMQDENKKVAYASTLQNMKAALDANTATKRAQTYYTESFSTACEVIQFLSGFGGAAKTYPAEFNSKSSSATNVQVNFSRYYKGIDVNVDRRVTKAILKLLKDSLPTEFLPDVYTTKNLISHEAIDKYVDEVFNTSVFCDWNKLQSWLKNPTGTLENDPMMQLYNSIHDKDREIFKTCQANADKARKFIYAYYNSVSDFKTNDYYPDADRTERLSFGTISDLQVDGKTIPYQTTLNSLVAKADNASIKDYQLNSKLKEIWQKKDYSKFGSNGDMPTCFITNGDVTGGNSGSPMMNGEGKLIGLVFDCNWESMTREFNYEKDLHKVICVDIRYLLLVTQKFSGSNRIVEEIEKANKG